MLRAIVGFCLAMALCGFLSQRLLAPGQPHAGYQHSPTRTSHIVSTARAVAVESDLESEHCDDAAEPLWLDLPGEPAVTHLLMGRMDRQTTHLELLLTCGRLLI